MKVSTNSVSGLSFPFTKVHVEIEKHFNTTALNKTLQTHLEELYIQAKLEKLYQIRKLYEIQNIMHNAMLQVYNNKTCEYKQIPNNDIPKTTQGSNNHKTNVDTKQKTTFQPLYTG